VALTPKKGHEVSDSNLSEADPWRIPLEELAATDDAAIGVGSDAEHDEIADPPTTEEWDSGALVSAERDDTIDPTSPTSTDPVDESISTIIEAAAELLDGERESDAGSEGDRGDDELLFPHERRRSDRAPGGHPMRLIDDRSALPSDDPGLPESDIADLTATLAASPLMDQSDDDTEDEETLSDDGSGLEDDNGASNEGFAASE